MATVELIYDGDCPNVHEARAQLLRAFARAKIEARWQEWRVDDEGSPARVHGYGSPTILVDGRDVAATEPTGGACCRLYAQPDGSVRGAPDIEPIVAALGRENQSDALRAALGTVASAMVLFGKFSFDAIRRCMPDSARWSRIGVIHVVERRVGYEPAERAGMGDDEPVHGARARHVE